MASNQLKVGLTPFLMTMELEVEIQNLFPGRSGQFECFLATVDYFGKTLHNMGVQHPSMCDRFRDRVAG